MIWDKPRILAKLRQLYKEGKDLSYNAMCRQIQPLVSAAAYHFGSYRQAVQGRHRLRRRHAAPAMDQTGDH